MSDIRTCRECLESYEASERVTLSDVIDTDGFHIVVQRVPCCGAEYTTYSKRPSSTPREFEVQAEDIDDDE